MLSPNIHPQQCTFETNPSGWSGHRTIGSWRIWCIWWIRVSCTDDVFGCLWDPLRSKMLGEGSFSACFEHVFLRLKIFIFIRRTPPVVSCFQNHIISPKAAERHLNFEPLFFTRFQDFIQMMIQQGRFLELQRGIWWGEDASFVANCKQDGAWKRNYIQ